MHQHEDGRSHELRIDITQCMFDIEERSRFVEQRGHPVQDRTRHKARVGNEVRIDLQPVVSG